MADTFHLSVVTPSGAAIKKDVASFTVTSKAGEITILPGHCPLLSALENGRMIVTLKDGAKEIFATAGGYLEADADHVNVICDRCLAGKDIDISSLQPKIADVEKQLADLNPDSPEAFVLTEELQWLNACLAVAGE